MAASNWHWIFWINVPVGLALLPLGRKRLAESFGPNSSLDITGVLIATAGLFGITWGLIQTGSAGWGSPYVVAPLATGRRRAGARRNRLTIADHCHTKC